MRPEGDNRRLARLRQLTADPALAPATGPPPPQTPEKPASPPAPDHDHVVAGVVARLLALPRRAVVRAEDETHLNLLPHVRASWTLRGGRPEVPTPGKNRKVTVFGALEVTTGAWCTGWAGAAWRTSSRCWTSCSLRFPGAPVIAVICDNDIIHHARKVTRYLDMHPRLELLYGALRARSITRWNGSGAR